MAKYDFITHRKREIIAGATGCMGRTRRSPYFVKIGLRQDADFFFLMYLYISSPGAGIHLHINPLFLRIKVPHRGSKQM